jgi:hypothetical protein
VSQQFNVRSVMVRLRSTAPRCGIKHVTAGAGTTCASQPPHATDFVAALAIEAHRATNLTIDSKLRGCDLVALNVDDVAPNGSTATQSTGQSSTTMTRNIGNLEN